MRRKPASADRPAAARRVAGGVPVSPPILAHARGRQPDRADGRGSGPWQPGPLGRGSFIYLRLRRETYSPQRLTAWSRRIMDYLRGGRDVFVYFKHERLGPLYAEQLAAQVRTSVGAPTQPAV
ncbi:MAG: DUF72 domain-containing protein [Chloroflexi bacterium]|nr:MAG: DUF72 domain-containing protein [Chloroflexota bacterium]